MKFHTSLSSILVNIDGNFLEQHSPMHPCKTPRATLLMLSKRGAPDENNVRHFLLYLVNSDGLFSEYLL